MDVPGRRKFPRSCDSTSRNRDPSLRVMSSSVQRPALIVADRWQEYELIDCGDGMKQERWGAYTLVRPDPQIIWPRHGQAPGARWENWDGFYHRSQSGGGKWETRRTLPEHWTISYTPLKLTFRIHPTSFKHTGLFPEQAVNWDWFSAKIAAARAAGREVSVLNLFGYTGAATVAALLLLLPLLLLLLQPTTASPTRPAPAAAPRCTNRRRETDRLQ